MSTEVFQGVLTRKTRKALTAADCLPPDEDRGSFSVVRSVAMNLGTLLSWMLCGLIVGVIARLLVRGWHRFGLLTTMVLGIVGSFVGGFLYWLTVGAPNEPFTLAGNAWHGWIV